MHVDFISGRSIFFSIDCDGAGVLQLMQLAWFFFNNALTIYIYWFVVFFRPVYISVFQFDFNCIQQQLMKSVKLTIKICDDGNDDDNNPKPKQR